MKKEYRSPNLEVKEFEVNNALALSNGGTLPELGTTPEEGGGNINWGDLH